MYFIGRVTLFFTGDPECRITIEFLHYFLDPEIIISLHAIFINASTKKFTFVNNAIPSYDFAFEHLLCYSMVASVYYNIDNIFKNRTYSILICL